MQEMYLKFAIFRTLMQKKNSVGVELNFSFPAVNEQIVDLNIKKKNSAEPQKWKIVVTNKGTLKYK